MNNSTPNIALLLFTRTPEEEVLLKNFVPQGTYSQQWAIAQKFIQHSKQVLADTGLPYFICTSAEQRGNNFGERLHAAFADLFSQGFNQVIAIGNDCPQLQPKDILAAVQKLQEQEAVVGPDTSGGVYLFGLTRQAFRQCSAFDSIRWNTASVLADIVSLFDINAACLNCLAKYSDINNSRDFEKAFGQKLFRPYILRFFRRLLGFLISYSEVSGIHLYFRILLPNLSFRGPPSIV